MASAKNETVLLNTIKIVYKVERTYLDPARKDKDIISGPPQEVETIYYDLKTNRYHREVRRKFLFGLIEPLTETSIFDGKRVYVKFLTLPGVTFYSSPDEREQVLYKPDKYSKRESKAIIAGKECELVVSQIDKICHWNNIILKKVSEGYLFLTTRTAVEITENPQVNDDMFSEPFSLVKINDYDQPDDTNSNNTETGILNTFRGKTTIPEVKIGDNNEELTYTLPYEYNPSNVKTVISYLSRIFDSRFSVVNKDNHELMINVVSANLNHIYQQYHFIFSGQDNRIKIAFRAYESNTSSVSDRTFRMNNVREYKDSFPHLMRTYEEDQKPTLTMQQAKQYKTITEFLTRRFATDRRSDSEKAKDSTFEKHDNEFTRWVFVSDSAEQKNLAMLKPRDELAIYCQVNGGEFIETPVLATRRIQAAIEQRMSGFVANIGGLCAKENEILWHVTISGGNAGRSIKSFASKSNGGTQQANVSPYYRMLLRLNPEYEDMLPLNLRFTTENERNKGDEYFRLYIRLLSAKANKGDPDSQYAIGLIYNNRAWKKGKNDKKAFEWFSRAADRGHIKAKYQLGNAYQKGHGIKKDYRKAMQYYLAAAEQLNDDAIGKLIGLLAEGGYGIEQDFITALMWSDIYTHYHPKTRYMDVEKFEKYLTTAEKQAAKNRADEWITGHPKRQLHASRHNDT